MKSWQKELRKKVLFSILTAGVLSTCVMGSVRAEDIYYAGEIYAGNEFVIEKSGIVKVEAEHKNKLVEISSGTATTDNRYAALVAKDNDVKIKADTIMVNADSLSTDSRLFGIVAEKDKSIVLEGNVNITVSADGIPQIRAIRNNAGKEITLGDFDSNIVVNATLKNGNDNGYMTGADAWSGAVNNFNGNTYITAKAENSGKSLWVNAIQTAGATMNFNGNITELVAENDNYTAQTIIALGDSGDFNNYPNGIVNFNSTEHTYLIAKSAYGVNCVGYGGSKTPNEVNFNGGDVILHAIITDGVAASNAIGILGGDNTTVSDKVNNFSIIVEGAGVDKSNMNNSNGTAGIYAEWRLVNINSKNFIVDVISGQSTDNVNFNLEQAEALKNQYEKDNFKDNYPDANDLGGTYYCTAYGLRADSEGIINVGSDTDTKINVSEGYKDAVGVYASNYYDLALDSNKQPYGESGVGIINILGNAEIVANGKTGSKALYAKNGGAIDIGSTGKTVSLTGDVVADNGTITLKGSDNTVNGVITSTNNGAINLTGENATYNVQHMEASNGGTITVGAGTTIAVDSANIVGANYLVTVSNNGVLDVASDSKIHILNAEKGQTFNIVDGSNEEAWKVENISADNFMLQYEKKEDSEDYIITTTVADAKEVFDGAVLIPDVLTQTLTNGEEGEAAYDFFNSAMDSNSFTKKQAADAINNAATMSELAGVSHATYSASNILTDAVADHMSLAKNLDHDTDIWAHYVHNKENIDGLAVAGGGARYDAQYNGIVVGADLYKQGKGVVGAALTYIDGKVSGNTRNEAEYYGVSIYGGVQNEDSAVIGDISYLHGKNEITQHNSGYTLTGEPKSDAFSIGVRAEQSFKAGAGKVVPYAGLRYMHLGTGNYTNSLGLHYDADDTDLFLLPVGVKYSAEHKTAGWTLRPIAEVGYVWAMGDRDGQQTVSLNGAGNGFGYDVTDSGSYIGRLALEAEKANVTYGLGYEYQKGDSVKANKWMVNLNWAF